MPNPLQEIWLEARCNRDAMPEKRVCDVCEFSNLLGVIDGDVPEWANMWGAKNVSSNGITDANMKVILTSTAIAHMFPDKIGAKECDLENDEANEDKDKDDNANDDDNTKYDAMSPQNYVVQYENTIASDYSNLLPMANILVESFKNLQESMTRVFMPEIKQNPRAKQAAGAKQASDKRKIVVKKTPPPLEFEAATVIKSHAACIGVYYVESDMEPVEVVEVIYKKVKKEVVAVEGREVICYNNDETYYECGPNGEIKGIIQVKK